MVLRDIIIRLDEFANDATIYGESATGSAQAVVAVEPEDPSAGAVGMGLAYLLEVRAAREAIEVWQAWRPGRSPTVDDKLDAVIYYAVNDAWLPME